MRVDQQPRPLSLKKQRAKAVRLYHGLEKQLLDESLAPKLTEFRNSFDPGDSVYHNSAAGWMLAESALVSTNLERESRHMLLNEARQDWQRALEIESAKTVNRETHNHALLGPSEIRLQTTIAASDIFEALIDNDLNSATRSQYYENLLYLGVKASEGYEYYEDEESFRLGRRGPDSQYVGIAHEMNALLILARLQSPSLTCTPAIFRADSGENFPRKTHDLQILNTKWGDIRNTLGIEVKTTPREEHFERYDAVLIGGTLHLHPDNLRDPTYLTELLVKDYKDILNKDEARSLDTITDNVVHTVRHGFRGSAQCRNVNDCLEIVK